MADKIQKAYRASKNIYDDVITQGRFLSKMYIKIFWSGTDDNEIARKVLSYIPDNIKGTILEMGSMRFLIRKKHSERRTEY
ncbi:hypothetical protein [Oribacterium sp. WCC10]|uniref:hypothetical protein n=1 Tax=Oribacterium sp. WCC10 TaxID=1855343 RepID=UPI0008E542C9|nr:hypothetical protein [Oribacterium sp. WCC10]SFG60457.1 hypothetical protein SAMN05216356_114103 [Oribacterium sp. WCC10]